MELVLRDMRRRRETGWGLPTVELETPVSMG